jgi:arylsulfatase A-like enzyme
MKDQGYATGQFGKNHLGDRNEYLPTVHGFDEFFGLLASFKEFPPRHEAASVTMTSAMERIRASGGK